MVMPQLFYAESHLCVNLSDGFINDIDTVRITSGVEVNDYSADAK